MKLFRLMGDVMTYEHEARELELFTENDADLYRQRIVPIVKNMQRRMAKGDYESEKAVRLWLYLIDESARKYCQLHGGTVRGCFPKPCREIVARSMRDHYEMEIKAQGGEMFPDKVASHA